MVRYLSSVFLFLFLTSCHTSTHLAGHSDQHYAVSKEVGSDSTVASMLQPYKQNLHEQMDVVVGKTDMMLTKAQPECTLGNFMADAQLQAAKRIDTEVVASVVNYGGIRLPYIMPGTITRGKMYELMPFDNMLYILEVPGDVLHQFCDHMAAWKGWPVSGLSFTIKEKKAENINICGQPLNETRVYKLAVNDYIANGGDNCDFLKKIPKRITNIFIRDILIKYSQALFDVDKPIHPTLEDRIRYAN